MATNVRKARHKTKLQQIADEMTAMLENGVGHGDCRWVHRKLPRGLEIVLQKTGSKHRLALAREGVDPAQHEIRLCFSAFAVPEGTDVAYVKRPKYLGKTHHQVTYHVAEMEWIEEPVPA